MGSSLSFALQVRSGEAAVSWRRRRRRARETFPSLPAFVVPPPRTTTAPPLPPLRALDGFLYHPGAAAAAAAAAAGGSLRRDGRSGGRETGSPGSSPLAVICKSLGGQQQNNCVSSPHKGTGWEEYSWGAKNLPLPSFVSRGWCELFGPAPPNGETSIHLVWALGLVGSLQEKTLFRHQEENFSLLCVVLSRSSGLHPL